MLMSKNVINDVRMNPPIKKLVDRLVCVVKWWRLKLGNNVRRVLRLGKFLVLDKTRGRVWNYSVISRVYQFSDYLLTSWLTNYARNSELLTYCIRNETQCFITRWNTKKRVEYFWRTSRCFIWWWNTVSNVWYHFSNRIILTGEIRMQNEQFFIIWFPNTH